MSSKLGIGFILLMLVFILSLSQASHAANPHNLQNKIRDYGYHTAAYARKGQWSLCGKKYDQAIKYLHKLKSLLQENSRLPEMLSGEIIAMD